MLFVKTTKREKTIEDRIKYEKEVSEIGEILSDEISYKNISSGDLASLIDISILLSKEIKVKMFTNTILRIFDTILDERNKIAWKSLPPIASTVISEKMLMQLTDIGHRLACFNNTNQTVNIVENNIAFESFIIYGNVSTDFTFPSMSNITRKVKVQFTAEIEPPLSDVPNCGHSSASGVIYRNLATNLDPKSTFVINSKLVAFSFTRNSSVKLEKNARIKLRLQHEWEKRRGDVSKCMFWNLKTSDWSEEGCRVDESTKSFTICECDHLTNFAVLMDISGREKPSETKSWLTLVCCTLSSICLMITICLLTSVRSLKSRRNLITSHLCLCLLFMNLLTSYGLQQTHNTILCRSISIMLMYTAASSFLWMLLEGYILYQMIILVFKSVGYISHRCMYCIGYGVSFIWVSVALVIVKPNGFFDNDKNYFCWISNFEQPGIIWIFIGPAFAIIILNVIVFIMSLRATIITNLKRKNSKETQQSNDLKANVKRWLKGWISLLILLGFTWILALLYVHADLYFASYIFIVCNGLQ
ncbi:latrophilin-3-like protein, partial [Leptotrombidium deliense]